MASTSLLLNFRLGSSARRNEILDRVLRNVKFSETIFYNGTPCMEWLKATSGKAGNGRKGRGHSYPRMALGNTTMAVHRVMYTHVFGIIPHKKQIDHLCNNRLCCNPYHLECVTHLRNQRRRDAKRKESRQ